LPPWVSFSLPVTSTCSVPLLNRSGSPCTRIDCPCPTRASTSKKPGEDCADPTLMKPVPLMSVAASTRALLMVEPVLRHVPPWMNTGANVVTKPPIHLACCARSTVVEDTPAGGKWLANEK
jgi:hypothetical protein